MDPHESHVDVISVPRQAELSLPQTLCTCSSPDLERPSSCSCSLWKLLSPACIPASRGPSLTLSAPPPLPCLSHFTLWVSLLVLTLSGIGFIYY